ncbi:hypothetical protein Tco_1007392 [Tanacetum coccineum]
MITLVCVQEALERIITEGFDLPINLREWFWNIATSKTVNSVKQIYAIVDGKAVLSTKLTFQKEPLQTETPPPVFHEPQTEAHIKQILPSPTTYQRIIKTQKCWRTDKDTKLPQTSIPQDLRVDEAVYKEGGDSVERAITTAASLDATHDRNGYRWLSQAPRHHGGTPAQTRSKRVLEKPNEPTLSKDTHLKMEGSMEYHFELIDNVPPTPYDSPLSGDNTPGSDEEEANTAQDRVINRLKLRVKMLEKKRKARTSQPMKRRLFKGRVETSTDISLGEDASKQGRRNDKTKPMFTDIDFDMLDAEQITTIGPLHVSTADQVSTARPEVSAATPSTPPTTSIVFDERGNSSKAQKLGKRLKKIQDSYTTHKSPKKPKVIKFAKDVTEEEAAEYEKEKEELRLSLKIISGDDSEMEAKDMEVYKLTRDDGSASYHGNIQAFLRRLDRQDLNDLYSLVQERFQDHHLEGHDLLLWGDLRMIFDLDEKDELWMNKLDWKLHKNYRVHTLFMDGTPMEINMLVEKKYPLIKELLKKMLNLQLEAEEESTMAFELIKFIKSLIEE